MLAQGVSREGLNVAYSSYKLLDRGLFELIGPFGLTTAVVSLSTSAINVVHARIGDLLLITITALLVLFGLTFLVGPLLALLVSAAGLALTVDQK